MLQYTMLGAPMTSDPLHYDVATHHVCFGSVYATLVTVYKKGDIKGIIADKWTVSNDHREWRFHIRSNVFFEGGDPITPSAVIQSLKRLAFMQKKRDSLSGFVDELVGYEDLDSLDSEFKGLKFEGDEVVFQFKKSFPTLLDHVSFGLYAIVHNESFDNKTGEWKDKYKTISSGAYRVSSWGKEQMTIEKREGYPGDLLHPDAFDKVLITWNEDAQMSGDMFFGSDDLISQNTIHSKYSFLGESLTKISYMNLMSWSHQDSPFNQKLFRTYLRDVFYQEFAKTGMKAIYSFYPTQINGIKEFSPNTNPERPEIKKNRVVNGPPIVSKTLKTKNISTAMRNALSRAGIEHHELTSYTAEEYQRDRESFQDVYKLDYGFTYTGIYIHNPEYTVKFMVLSKEGIQLPDPTGGLKKIALSDQIDIVAVNKILWEDAIIWPLLHSQSGIFYDEERVSIDLLEPTANPPDFSWVGAK